MLAVLIVLALALAALVAHAATRPSAFRIERAIHIAAPIVQVAEQIDDFRRWQAWSPWERGEPTLQRTFSGADAGVGAVYEWSGPGKAGAGRMEITEMRAGAERGLIAVQIDFLRPFKARHTTEFVLTPTTTGTDLTWAMSGDRPLAGRLVALFIDLDRLVGKDFEAGLEALRRHAEQAPR